MTKTLNFGENAIEITPSTKVPLITIEKLEAKFQRRRSKTLNFK